MKIEKINKRIEEIDQNAAKTTKETNKQIEKLSEDLEAVCLQIEETYRSGDIEKGQQLAEQKAILESKIKFLKSFLVKRNSVPLLNDDESVKMRKDLNNELFNVLHEQIRKTDELFKELESIYDVLYNAITETEKTGKDIIRLSKSNETFFRIDQKVSVFADNIYNFKEMYKNYLKYYYDQK